MLRNSPALHLWNLRTRVKYPTIVSYNKFPWVTLQPDTPALHLHVVQHYERALETAAAHRIPTLVNDYHLDVPPHQHLFLLPGALYIIPNLASRTPLTAPTTKSSGEEALQILQGHAPFKDWSMKPVKDDMCLQHYGPIQARIGKVQAVVQYASSDLRLFCNGLLITNLHVPILPLSSFGQVKGGVKDLALFHFFRPNRPPIEISRALSKSYRSVVPQPHVVDVLAQFSRAADWTPKLNPPVRTTIKRVSMPRFVPPTSYLYGRAEVMAVRPGDAFGRRSLMWGNWF